MIRPIATEIGLFLLPFVAYAAFLLATRAGVMNSTAWPARRVASLVIASLILVIGSLLVLVQFGRPPPNAVYVPAHTENGKFVPQTYR